METFSHTNKLTGEFFLFLLMFNLVEIFHQNALIHFKLHKPTGIGAKHIQLLQEILIDRNDSLLPDTKRACFDDAILFEVGCYSIFRIDLWLHANHQAIRNNFMDCLSEGFLLMFSSALENHELESLLNNRMIHYGRIIRETKSTEKNLFHLEQLILHTKNNIVCSNYTFDGDPIAQANLPYAIEVRRNLYHWEQTIDLFTQYLKLYCSKLKK